VSPVPLLFPLSPSESAPDRDFVSLTDPEDDIDAPSREVHAEDVKHQCPPGALDKSSWLQARKVFVGGIPQTWDQKELYSNFSRIGKVKKATLMLPHNDQGASKGSPAKKHRGFAFVVFCEIESVFKLLDTDFSRFVSFPNDVTLEVKRSVSKAPSEEKKSAGKAKRSTMETAPPQTPTHQKTVASSHTFPSASPVGLQMSSCPSPWQSPSVAIAPQAFLIPYPVLVPVPAFPAGVTTAVQWAPLGGITACSYPPVAPAQQRVGQQPPKTSAAQPGQHNPLDQQPHRRSLPDDLSPVDTGAAGLCPLQGHRRVVAKSSESSTEERDISTHRELSEVISASVGDDLLCASFGLCARHSLRIPLHVEHVPSAPVEDAPLEAQICRSSSEPALCCEDRSATDDFLQIPNARVL